MSERSDDSLLSRVLLLLLLPLAALLGVVCLEDGHDGGLRFTLEEDGVPPEALTGLEPRVDAGAGAGVFSPAAGLEPIDAGVAPREWSLVVRPSANFIHRAAYTRLLRHQLLRIPDPARLLA